MQALATQDGGYVKDLATRFMRALRDRQTMERWQRAKNDGAALRIVVKDALGLAELPTEEDIQGMREYADAVFTTQLPQLLAGESAPYAVGVGFTVQDDTSHAVGIAFTVQDDAPHAVGMGFTVQDKATHAVGLAFTVQDDAPHAVGNGFTSHN